MSTEPTVTEETKIDDIAENLYRRIAEETEAKLTGRLKVLGVTAEQWKAYGERKVFPLDDLKMAEYSFKGQRLLLVGIAENRMSIEFDMPKIETQ